MTRLDGVGDNCTLRRRCNQISTCVTQYHRSHVVCQSTFHPHTSVSIFMYWIFDKHVCVTPAITITWQFNCDLILQILRSRGHLPPIMHSYPWAGEMKKLSELHSCSTQWMKILIDKYNRVKIRILFSTSSSIGWAMVDGPWIIF